MLPIMIVVLAFFSARTLCRPPDRIQLFGESMGTTWAVTLNAPGLSTDQRNQADAAVRGELDRVNEAMSTWLPESELSRFNRHTSGEAFPLSDPTLEVLEIAQQVGTASDGALDVTVRPLVAAWGFGAGARVPGEGPGEAELASLREKVGWSHLHVDRKAGTAQKAHGELEVDLSAVAKGYAVDRVAAALVSQGLGDFLVEVGGEVAARGRRPDGGLWRLAVEEPNAEGRVIHAVVELDQMGMATSGDYRSFYEAGGERLTHIIDPRTGRPISHGLASVTVLHPSTTVADAWATALTALGPEEGFAIADKEGIAAYFIARQSDGSYVTRRSPTFPELLDPADKSGANE